MQPCLLSASADPWDVQASTGYIRLRKTLATDQAPLLTNHASDCGRRRRLKLQQQQCRRALTPPIVIHLRLPISPCSELHWIAGSAYDLLQASALCLEHTTRCHIIRFSSRSDRLPCGTAAGGGTAFNNNNGATSLPFTLPLGCWAYRVKPRQC